MTTFTWTIDSLERFTADDRVHTVHYTVLAEDGVYSASISNTASLNGEVSVPYADLTEETVISWIKEQFFSETLDQLEAILQAQLDEQATPTQASGVPW